MKIAVNPAKLAEASQLVQSYMKDPVKSTPASSLLSTTTTAAATAKEKEEKIQIPPTMTIPTTIPTTTTKTTMTSSLNRYGGGGGGYRGAGISKISLTKTKDRHPQRDMQPRGRVVDQTLRTLFDSVTIFRKYFANPLLIAREPGSTDSEVALGERRQQELSDITSKYILRRTNELNKVHLPNKLTLVVCVRMAPLQCNLYRHLVERAQIGQDKSNSNSFSTFAAISALRKLVNHPALLSRTLSQTIQKKGEAGYFLEEVDELMPPEFTGSRVRNADIEQPHHSGKMLLVYKMMTEMMKVKGMQKERIVLVSNFTETLDIFARMLSGMNAKYVRLDGGIAVNKRQRLVDEFNDHSKGVFAFLLSSKAGGCGLNLIGGSRLILFDPSWNPADDRQAAARIWRDGQKKKCFIYRLLATGSIEEKIFQRQVTKEGLASLVMEEDIAGESAIAQDDTRRLFEFQEDTCSDTHDMLHCTGCAARAKHWTLHPRAHGYKPEASGADDASLLKWAHHANISTVDDDLLKKCGDDHVSYSFSLECRNDV